MISLCMIVKNEEKYLHDCLKSVKGVADEIIIIDTGSTDNTVKIAEEHKAKIFKFDWIGDFSAARNYSLECASGDWVLYLDADERLDKHSVDEIKKLTREKKKTAYKCRVISIDEVRKHPSVMAYVRLFPLNDKIRFSGKVHEQIEYSLIENNYEITDSSVEIIHLGYSVDDDELKKKAERNLELLLKEYSASGSSYYALQTAQTYGILEQKEKAEEYFLLALKDKNLKKEYRSLAYRYLSICAAERKEFKSSLELIENSIAEDGGQPLSFMAAAKIYLKFKMPDKACDAAMKAYKVNKIFLSNKKSLSAQSILMDEKELAYHGLEVAITAMDKDLFNFFYKIISSGNSDPAVILFNALYNQQQISEGKINQYTDNISSAYLEPLLALLQEYKHAESKLFILQSLAEKFPGVPPVFVSLAALYAQAGRLNDAEAAYEALISMQPDEASYYFFLVSVYLRNSKLEKLLSLIGEAETRFASSPEVISRINILKEKLAQFIS